MKGIILAGGAGTRLYPLTMVTSKQLLPVYDKPMIYYPLSTLMLAGIQDILIISTPTDTPRFEALLGDGSQYGIHLQYKVQPSPDGLAQAFILGEEFIGDDCCAMILGDNIFYGNGFSKLLKSAVANAENKGRCTVFGYYVQDPERFGIVEFDKDGKQVGEAKKYTPKSFYEETVGKDLNGTFLMVMNDPRRPYHKTYEVEYDRHTYDGHNWKYLNLPMEEIAQLAIASLKDGHKMYSSYDVGKQLDRKRGYLALDNFDYGSLFNTSFPMNKADRIATFDSGSTHAMTLTAVDLDANGKPVKWKVENSWGADNGFAGCFIMTNDWFNEYMFRLVVNKKYASEQLLKEFDQKPTMLTPDDPLFQLED